MDLVSYRYFCFDSASVTILDVKIHQKRGVGVGVNLVLLFTLKRKTIGNIQLEKIPMYSLISS